MVEPVWPKSGVAWILIVWFGVLLFLAGLFLSPSRISNDVMMVGLDSITMGAGIAVTIVGVVIRQYRVKSCAQKMA